MEVKREDAAPPSSPPASPSPRLLPPHLPPSVAHEIFGLEEEEEEEEEEVRFSVIEKASPSSNCQTDGKHQESSSKSHTTQMKDERSTYLADPTELGYFGSSVHYGGRDYYTCSQSTTTSRLSDARLIDPCTSYEEDDLDDSHYATRGNWWQGSLYY